MTTATSLPYAGERAGTPHVGSSAVSAFRTRVQVACVPLVVVTLAVAAWSTSLRWQIANEVPLQCDEIPLLIRFTGLNGVATTEAEAQEFRPSLFSFRSGALRSLRVPDYQFTIHTTAGFWSNLTLHLFGYSAGGVRSIQVFWSVVAIVAVAWAAWLAVGSVPAACLAGWFVAMSPFSLAYGTQARGYAEAMALTPLLLIALEYFRRKPDRWLRGVCVLLCAFQLSLTVYTMWIYWVLPVIVLAIILVPREVADPLSRRTARTMLVLVTLGLILAMSIYTADRWKQLIGTSSIASRTGPEWGGADFTQWNDLLTFATRLCQQVFVWPVAIPVLALCGMAVLRKSRTRWWVWVFTIGVVAPLVFGLVNGSPGYVRNLAYLLGPAAILSGIALDRGLRVACRGVRPVAAYGLAAAALLVITASSSADIQRRARAILFPDWGAFVLALNDEPETVGPRWIAPCLANHWQINWYRLPRDDAAFLSVEPGETIEVVMGARHESDDVAIVYRPDPIHGNVQEVPLPDYLASVVPFETRRSVEVRRWVGTSIEPNAFLGHLTEAPVALFALTEVDPSAAQWRRFWDDGKGADWGVVTFKPAAVLGGRIQSMILPAEATATIVKSLQDHLGLDPQNIHIFTLSPLQAELSPPLSAAASPGKRAAG